MRRIQETKGAALALTLIVTRRAAGAYAALGLAACPAYALPAPSDYVKGRLTIRSKKGARQEGFSEISLTIELRDSVANAVREHVEGLPKRSKIMFPMLDQFDYTGGNERWKGKSQRTAEQRRCDKADRLFEKLIKGTDFERLDGYHALRHSFISILVAYSNADR